MRRTSTATTVGIVLLVVLAGIAGSMVVATQTSGSSVSIDATPSDSPPASGESTHAVVFTVGSDATAAGQALGDVRVDYSVDQPTAQVGNVGEADIERIGIDRNNDDPGTQIDDSATISSVTGQADGQALLVETQGNLNIQAGDQIVLVAQQVQNPDTQGADAEAQVDTTINSQGDLPQTETGTVSYGFNNATVDFRDQETTGETVTVNSVNLSEGGFIAISNDSAASPNEVRGTSDYLPAGQYSNVEITLDEPLQSSQTLYAQAHLDTNADRTFNYTSSGGSQDELYRTGDGNIQTNGPGAEAQVTVVESTSTATPTPTDSGGSSDEGDDDPEITNYRVTSDGSEITVSFDSDETLVDIEVEVRGAETATLTEEDFSGDRFEGYTATYQAGTDGDYTLELVTARDSSNNDGADDGDFSDSTTVDSSSGDGSSGDSSTATPTPDDGGDATATPTDDGGTADETATPTADGGSETTESPTDDGGTDETESPADDGGTDGTDDGSMDGTDDGSMDETDTMDGGDDSEGDDSEGGDSGSDGDGAGFGGAIAVAALLASALLFYRRH